jgi:NAD(P)H dehydrogenase (quinone)
MIVITGAGGRVGGLAAQLLAERGKRMRLLTRDPSRVPPIRGRGVVRIDGFEDREPPARPDPLEA